MSKEDFFVVDRLEIIGDSARAYLETAKMVAEGQFGSEVVDSDPTLVVRTAQLIAWIDHNRVMESTV